jgi:hypothetical protein
VTGKPGCGNNPTTTIPPLDYLTNPKSWGGRVFLRPAVQKGFAVSRSKRRPTGAQFPDSVGSQRNECECVLAGSDAL